MINNFMCEHCSHSLVCEKTKHLLKFHETAKKCLFIDITMDSCEDYKDDNFAAEEDEGEE